jgi:hypothetical protein
LDDQTIVRAAIHPGIGIARVGNSADEYFFAPEVCGPQPVPDGGYKDAKGAVKRQAARFRIYGFNAAGRLVGEITAATAEIRWAVHVANTKSAWFNFPGPLDIPEATPVTRRNPDFTGAARDQLKIDPGVRSIGGRNQSGPQYCFDTGTFVSKPVYLGELRTDADGRLIFLAGRGLSETPFPHNTITTYADNRGWHDDIADGPVSAEVSINGVTIPVDPAWVVSAPPNFAPDIIAIRTLYDVLVDAYQPWWMIAPARQRVSFTQDIYPILQRFCQYQWVNFGYFIQFGWKAPFDLMRRDYMQKLGEKSVAAKELRTQIFNQFRNPNSPDLQMAAWPQAYGDYVQIPPAAPLSMLAVTPTQYAGLQKWVAGEFEADWQPDSPPAPQTLDAVPLADRPATLDRAALEFCLGGPFHPGCELTWPMRHYTMYCAPFRIRPRAPNQPERDYGDVLTPEVALGETGPLFSNGPGDLTRWMSVPWQADSAGCRSGYTAEYDPYLPTFWPARVPNHVFAFIEFQKIAAGGLSEPERMAAFAKRANWLRMLDGGILTQMQQMTREWSKAGIVVRKDLDADGLPRSVYVEMDIGYDKARAPDHNLVVSTAQRAALANRRK